MFACRLGFSPYGPYVYLTGGDHLVPDSGLEKEEDNFRGGEPKTFLSSAKLLIVTVYKTLYVTYTCRLIAIIFVKVKVYP